MDELVGFEGVDDVGSGPVFERPQMVVRVVAHLMAFGHNAVVEFRMLSHILAHHEESCFHAVMIERVENEGRGFGNGAVVEGEVNGLLAGVHSPRGLWVEPSQPFGWLFYNHSFVGLWAWGGKY